MFACFNSEDQEREKEREILIQTTSMIMCIHNRHYVTSDITYRMHFEGVITAIVKRKTRLVVHFNCLKPYCVRPAQLQLMHSSTEDVVSLHASSEFLDSSGGLLEDVVNESVGSNAKAANLRPPS